MKGLTAVLIGLALLALSAQGCGSDGSTAASETVEGYYKGSTYYPPGPSKEFVIPDGDNTIQYFGQEADPREREAASRSIEAWMRARSAKDWPSFCRLMSKAYIDNLVTDAERVTKGDATNCVQAMLYFGDLASGGSTNTMTGPIDSLRISGAEGYAQYHGINGVDWIVPVEKEEQGWRVGVSAPINRTK